MFVFLMRLIKMKSVPFGLVNFELLEYKLACF